MLVQNQPIKNIQPVRINQTRTSSPIEQESDKVVIENSFVNKKPLIDRKIIKPEQNINEFFDNISAQIFPNSPMSHSLSKLLQMGYISLSSSAYTNPQKPHSAIALKLDETKSNIQHCAFLEQYLKNGVGVGINFSNFNNPTQKIKSINEYFKFREPNLNRPPAGIALLNITHPKIVEFISLKDSANYKNWCFDLSVIIDSTFLSKVDRNEDIILDNGSKMNAKALYLKLLDSMKKSGEPGIIFSDNKHFICDSCAATELKENEGLNLAQINLSRFVNPKTKTVDYAFLSQSANILTIALKRMAPNGFVSILGYQDMLNQLGLNYGSKEALEVLQKCLGTIKEQAQVNGVKMCISPTGTTSRILKTTPSIEPIENNSATYWDEIETLEVAQRYLEGGISKTFNLKEKHSIDDIDLIVRTCAQKNIKGISVFPAQ